MTLKELLVQELPKRGGWPVGAEFAHCLGFQIGFYMGNRVTIMPPWTIGLWASPLEDKVTREQYESALAASQKVEWDGEGLPSVGSKVEALTQGEWVEVVVAYTEAPEIIGVEQKWREALVFDSKTTRPFWADELRPLRSEADKKREEVKHAIAELCRYSASNGHSADLIYDAIAAGKIPGVRIE